MYSAVFIVLCEYIYMQIWEQFSFNFQIGKKEAVELLHLKF